MADAEESRAAKAARKAARRAAAAAAAATDAEPAIREDESVQPAVGAGEAPAAEASHDVEDDEARAARKARKAAKRAARAAAADAVAAAPLPTADESAPGDSKKKRKRSDSDSAAAPHASAGSGTALRKAFYTPTAAVLALSPAAVAAFRAERSIVVEDPHSSDEWRPIPTFAAVGGNFPSAVMAVTKDFPAPSPVQAQTWPIQLSGRDIVGIAATGSGKTLAFLLPAFVHIKAQRDVGNGPGLAGPICLVLAPTRELAMQTATVATEAGALLGLRSTCIYGGVPKDEQRRMLRASGGVHVVVATPGRLMDLQQEGSLNLSRVTFLVLDEADRMLDMGFEKDIRAIVSTLRADRQTLMFSATWPPAIQAIAAEFLTRPVKVMIGAAELSASHSVTQIVEVVNPEERDGLLLKLLAKYHVTRKNRVLVFVLYKKEADRVERFLTARGWASCAIHGDLSQEARTRAFNSFKDGKVPLLVATDVAARGLDIPSVEYVINYSFPLTIEDYVHRIGRTGRGGATGISHTFFTQLDKGHAGELVNVLREAGQTVPADLLKFGTHVKKKEHALYGAHFKADVGGPAAAPVKMKFSVDDD